MKFKSHISRQLNLLKVLKIAFGALLAAVIASLCLLSYYTSAGVITILSIQNTKKETLLIVGKRIGAFVLAFLIAFVSFSWLGYRLIAITLFLVVFVSVCNLLYLQDAIVMNTVLILHFYAEQSMSLFWIRNESLLLLIGTGVGVLMNSYMPKNSKIIRENQKEVEREIREIFYQISVMIRTQERIHLNEVEKYLMILDKKLSKMEVWAYEEQENVLMSENRYFIKYVELRKNQSFVLKKIYKNIQFLHIVPRQAIIVADYIEEISKTFHERNNGERLKERLQDIQETMRGEELPKTREEFENRAVLYRILYDIEEFLQLKIQFVTSLTEEEIQRFW